MASEGRADFAGFILYYSCGCRRLVLSRTVKPTPLPTILGYINFTLLFFLYKFNLFLVKGDFFLVKVRL